MENAKTKRKSPAKKTSKQSDFIALLQKFEQSGKDGLVVCAPKSLQDKVQALRYTPKGDLKATDKLRKTGLFAYVEEAGSSTMELPATGKRKGKAKTVHIRRYALSKAGLEYLQKWRAEEEKKQEIERKKQVAEIEGIKTGVQEYSTKVQDLQKKLDSSLDAVAEKVDKQIALEIPKFKQDASNQIARVEERMKTLQSQCEEQIKTLREQIQGSVRDMQTVWQGQAESLEKWRQNLENQIRQDVAILKTSMQNLDSTSQIWTKAILESPALKRPTIEEKPQPKPTEPKSPEPVAIAPETPSSRQTMPARQTTPAVGKTVQLDLFESPQMQAPVVQNPAAQAGVAAPPAPQPTPSATPQPVSAPSTVAESIQTISKINQQLVSQILPLIPQEQCKEISLLHQELCSQGIPLSPGHLNDILWAMFQQNLIFLEKCDTPLNSLPSPENVILRWGPSVYRYVRILRR